MKPKNNSSLAHLTRLGVNGNVGKQANSAGKVNDAFGCQPFQLILHFLQIAKQAISIRIHVPLLIIALNQCHHGLALLLLRHDGPARDRRTMRTAMRCPGGIAIQRTLARQHGLSHSAPHATVENAPPISLRSPRAQMHSIVAPSGSLCNVFARLHHFFRTQPVEIVPFLPWNRAARKSTTAQQNIDAVSPHVILPHVRKLSQRLLVFQRAKDGHEVVENGVRGELVRPRRGRVHKQNLFFHGLFGGETSVAQLELLVARLALHHVGRELRGHLVGSEFLSRLERKAGKELAVRLARHAKVAQRARARVGAAAVVRLGAVNGRKALLRRSACRLVLFRAANVERRRLDLQRGSERHRARGSHA